MYVIAPRRCKEAADGLMWIRSCAWRPEVQNCSRAVCLRNQANRFLRSDAWRFVDLCRVIGSRGRKAK